MTANPKVITVPAETLWGQPWAESLHSTVIRAFKRKDIQAFPPSWTRLNPDPAIGISGLSFELGDQGFLVVLLEDGEVIGCSGFLPFRGNDWISKEKIVDAWPDSSKQQQHLWPEEWEICCFCILPEYRMRGLSKTLLNAVEAAARAHGGQRLAVNYSSIETKDFWPRAGFMPIPGATSVLQKGFTHTRGMEGLRADIHFQVAMKQL
jgi:ribosomal protein S18 acetylase RimI-like enzyme